MWRVVGCVGICVGIHGLRERFCCLLLPPGERMGVDVRCSRDTGMPESLAHDHDALPTLQGYRGMKVPQAPYSHFRATDTLPKALYRLR